MEVYMGRITKQSLIGQEIEFKFTSAMTDYGNGTEEKNFRNENYGMGVKKSRQSKDHPWRITFTLDAFPEKIFHNKEEMEEAFDKLKALRP